MATRVWPQRWTTGMPAVCWLPLAVGLFAVLLGASVVAHTLVGGYGSVRESLILAGATVVWGAVLWMPPLVVVLLVLLALRQVPWYWFRLAALALIGAPALLMTSDPGVLAAYLPAQVVLALALVQPRLAEDDTDPTMESHLR
jgi:hypothetical protein